MVEDMAEGEGFELSQNAAKPIGITCFVSFVIQFVSIFPLEAVGSMRRLFRLPVFYALLLYVDIYFSWYSCWTSLRAPWRIYPGYSGQA